MEQNVHNTEKAYRKMLCESIFGEHFADVWQLYASRDRLLFWVTPATVVDLCTIPAAFIEFVTCSASSGTSPHITTMIYSRVCLPTNSVYVLRIVFIKTL